MKTLIMGVLLVVFSVPSVAFGITARDIKNIEPDIAPLSTSQSEKVFLLSWQGDYIRTTVGTIYSKGVSVINRTGLDRDQLNSLKKLPEVRITRSGNIVIQVDILTAK